MAKCKVWICFFSSLPCSDGVLPVAVGKTWGPMTLIFSSKKRQKKQATDRNLIASSDRADKTVSFDFSNSDAESEAFSCFVFKMFLKGLLSGSYWVQDSSSIVFVLRLHPFLEEYCKFWGSLWRVLPTLLVLHPLKQNSHDAALLNKCVLHCYTTRFKKK